MRQVTIYTDGCCLRNPGGAGGVAALVIIGSEHHELSEGFSSTTNNRMEMLAVALALEALAHPSEVRLFSDSTIVVNGVNQGAPHLRGKKQTAKPNHDLWQRIRLAMKGHAVKAEWVRGHVGHEHNERCDWLAGAAARNGPFQEDAGYRPLAQPSLF